MMATTSYRMRLQCLSEEFVFVYYRGLDRKGGSLSRGSPGRDERREGRLVVKEAAKLLTNLPLRSILPAAFQSDSLPKVRRGRERVSGRGGLRKEANNAKV